MRNDWKFSESGCLCILGGYFGLDNVVCRAEFVIYFVVGVREKVGDVFLKFIYSFICGILKHYGMYEDDSDIAPVPTTRLATSCRWWVWGLQVCTCMLRWLGGCLKATISQVGSIVGMVFFMLGWNAVQYRPVK